MTDENYDFLRVKEPETRATTLKAVFTGVANLKE